MRKNDLSTHGYSHRHKKDMDALVRTLKALRKNLMISADESPPKMFCKVIGGVTEKNHTVSGNTTVTESYCKAKSNSSTSKEVYASTTMAYHAEGVREVLKSKTQIFSDQALSVEVMHGSVEGPFVEVSLESESCSSVNSGGLAYTREDFQILKSSQVSNDIRAAVIWRAIEREQSGGGSEVAPPSSSIITARLYNSKVFGDAATSTLLHKSFIADDDAMMIHSTDAILSHYMKDLNKIDPFETSRFSMDVNLALTNTTLPENVRKYFKVDILDSMQLFKMKFGQKITSSLLTSASHMHLNSRCRLSSNRTFAEDIDDDSDNVELSSDIEFIGDVMRLLASKWREWAEMKKKTSRGGNEKGKKNDSTPRTKATKNGLAPQLDIGQKSKTTKRKSSRKRKGN